MAYPLRFALFLGLIVVPAGILTFLSVRGFQDEQRSALADVRLRVPAVRAVFHELLASTLGHVAESVRQGQPLSRVEDSLREVQFVFTLDASGNFVFPPVIDAVLTERSPGFDDAIRAAERLEFQARELPASVPAYQSALVVAVTLSDSVEALNALGRVYAATGDEENSGRIHRRLQALAFGVDADGAHPLTLSYLRRARLNSAFASRRDSLAIDRSMSAIGQWSAAVLSGEIPLTSGTRLAVGEFMQPMTRYSWVRDVEPPRADLRRIEARAGFVADYGRLLGTAVVRPEATYLSGLSEGGRPCLAALQPKGGGTSLGAVIDLDAMAGSILASAAGVELSAAGFAISLFDADFTSEFERRYSEGVHFVTPASTAIYRCLPPRRRSMPPIPAIYGPYSGS